MPKEKNIPKLRVRTSTIPYDKTLEEKNSKASIFDEYHKIRKGFQAALSEGPLVDESISQLQTYYPLIEEESANAYAKLKKIIKKDLVDKKAMMIHKIFPALPFEIALNIADKSISPRSVQEEVKKHYL